MINATILVIKNMKAKMLLLALALQMKRGRCELVAIKNSLDNVETEFCKRCTSLIGALALWHISD